MLSRNPIHLKKTPLSPLFAVAMATFSLFGETSDSVTAGTYAELAAALADPDVSVVKLTKTITLPDGAYLSAFSTASGDRKVIQTMEPFVPADGRLSVTNNTLYAPAITAGVNDYNLFDIAEGSRVVISNVTLMGGFTGSLNATYTANTGGIDNYGDLQLYDCEIRRTGTALLNRPGATAVLVGCNIIHNANWFGGGILNLSNESDYSDGGTVIMDRCSLTENQSFGSEHGGGAAENQGLMCLNNCVVANNTSTEIGGGINNCKNGTLYVMNSTLTGNVTTSDAYGVTAGGAIGNAGGAGHVYVVNSILSNNGYDTGEHVNPVCIGRYEGSTDAHACNIINSVIGATAGMDRIDSTNSSSKVDGLFAGYTTSGIVAAGGEHDGMTSSFTHPGVVSPDYAPVMAQQETNHFVFVMAVPTYFDYSMIVDGTGETPGMAYESSDGVRSVLGPDVADTDKLVEETFDGGSRLEMNCVGSVSVRLLDPEPSPDPGIFWVRLGEFTGGRVSGVTIYGDYYLSNSVITVHAEPASAYYLVGWAINGAEVPDSAHQNVFSFHIETNSVIKPLFIPVETGIIRARQRYPWNNLVDIDYSVKEEDAERYRIVFLATFGENGTNRTVQLKSFVSNSDGRTPQRLGEKPDLRRHGHHRVTWDSAADGISLKNRNVTLRIMACEGDER